MKKNHLFVLLPLLLLGASPLRVFSQSETENYVLTRTYREAGNTASQYMDRIQYYDGLGRESQLVLNIPQPERAPKSTSTDEKMNCHIKPSTIPPMRFGVKKPARKKFLPTILPESIYASANAIAFTSTTEQITYLMVSHIEDQNAASLNISI